MVLTRLLLRIEHFTAPEMTGSAVAILTVELDR